MKLIFKLLLILILSTIYIVITMILFKGILIIFVLILHQEVSSEAFLKMKEILEFVDKWSTLIDIITFVNDALNPGDKMPEEILNTVREVSEQLDRIGIHLDQKLDVFAINLPKQIRDLTKIDRDVDDIVTNVRDINYLYKTYYVNIFNGSVSNYTIDSFVTTVTGIGTGSPRKVVENIYVHFYSGELSIVKDSLLYTIVKTLQAQGNTRCDEFQSPQQWLYELYSLISVVEIRALIMITSAFKIRSKSTGDNYENDIKLIKEQYLDRMNNYLIIMKEAFTLMPADIRRCDPKVQEKGKTYIELEKFARILLVNADQLSSGETCQDCERFKNQRYNSPRSTTWRNVKLQETCNGILSSCTTWSSREFRWVHYHHIEVCKMPEGNTRRYQYLIDSDGRVSGDKSSCPGSVIQDLPYHFCPLSIDDRIFIPARCSNSKCNHCLCTCVEDNVSSKAIRKFDLDPKTSHCHDNMVVVGVKIVIDDEKIIRLQIKEGKLLPGGMILPGSEKWVPVEPTNDKYVGRMSQYPREMTDIHLEDRVTPDETYVVTGVAFYILTRDQDRDAISIKMYTRKFNYTSGLIDCSNFEIIDSGTGNYHGANLNIGDADNPLKSQINLPDVKDEKFVRVQPSSIQKDAGQTVIPFIDIQPVYSKPPFPLRGIGLYHKGAPGFGGFVALRILTLNMGSYIDTNRT